MSNKAKTTEGVQPKLRFPEFRDACDWEEEKIEKLYSFKSTNSLSREKLTMEKGNVKNIHYGDIHTKFSTHFDIEKENVPYIVESESLEKVKPDSFCIEGDVIFADASEDMDDIGKSIEIVNLNNEKVLSGLHTILARQKKDLLKIGFAGHLFQSPRLRAKIQKEAQGAKVLGISGGRLASIDVCFPIDKKEQKKIADCLSSLDELIEAEGQKLASLQQHKKGLMQELFPAKGETLPNRRFPEFQDAEGWKVKPLGRIAEVLQGFGFPEKHQGKTEGKFPFYKVSDISNSLLKGEHLIKDSANYIDEETLKALKAKLIPVGATIFAKIGEAIRSNRRAVTSVPCLIDNNVAALKSKQGETIDGFVYYTFSLIRLEDYSGGAVPSVNKSTIENITIACPNIPEQQRIADCLSSLDELIEAEGQKLASLQRHKKGLMQKLFPTVSEVQE